MLSYIWGSSKPEEEKLVQKFSELTKYTDQTVDVVIKVLKDTSSWEQDKIFNHFVPLLQIIDLQSDHIEKILKVYDNNNVITVWLNHCLPRVNIKTIDMKFVNTFMSNVSNELFDRFMDIFKGRFTINDLAMIHKISKPFAPSRERLLKMLKYGESLAASFTPKDIGTDFDQVHTNRIRASAGYIGNQLLYAADEEILKNYLPFYCSSEIVTFVLDSRQELIKILKQYVRDHTTKDSKNQDQFEIHYAPTDKSINRYIEPLNRTNWFTDVQNNSIDGKIHHIRHIDSCTFYVT